MNRTSLTWILALVIGALTFAFRYLSYNGFANDHFVHLSTAQQLLLGELPVRDFVERGFPLMSGMSAAAQVVLGPGLWAELVLVASSVAMAAAMVFAVASAAARSRVAGVAAALTTVAAAPIGYAYPKHLVYAFTLAAAWWYGRQPKRSRLVVLALAVAAAFYFRHDHGVLLAAGTTAFLLATHGRSAVRPVGQFAGIVFACVAPFVLWVQVYEGVGAYIEDGIAFSQREADRSKGWWPPPSFALDRSQPLIAYAGGSPTINVRWADTVAEDAVTAGERRHALTRLGSVGPHTWQYQMTRWSSSDIEALVRDRAVADTQGIKRQDFELNDPMPWYNGWPMPGPGMQLTQNAVPLLYWVLWATPFICLVVLLVSRAARRPPVAPFVLMLAVVQLGLNATMLRDPVALRVRDVVVPAALAAAIGAAALWRLAPPAALRVATRGLAVIGLVVLAAASGLAGSVGEHLDDANVRGGLGGMRARAMEIGKELSPPRHRTGRADSGHEVVAAYLAACTSPDDRVFVMAFAPELFFYAGRGFGGGHVTLTPGYYVTARHADLMVSRLSKESVPIVLFDSSTREEYLADYPRVTDFVAQRYREAGRFPVRGGSIVVWTETARPPIRTYGADALPCFAPAA